ncbi:patatin-like phospholipase family protein [Undibacterium terreum]|uniref:Patatin n=1 Tax=Undibacterium terreum TaxID=1224302 RepID=A0A916UHX9_9BURK|nr:patatin-like phospholipase family protein [Undibacterium terreum]GGC73281.1 patatin [Undibacterium terreum]
MNKNATTGLILTGGGARAAYQVGVLKAISEILQDDGWHSNTNPFGIICGTSAGAINATALACRTDNFGEAINSIVDVWEHFEAAQVYRADSLGVIRSGARWLSIMSFGWLLNKWRKSPPNSLLDNSPLENLLNRMLDLPRLDQALASGALRALAVTASSYTAGHHLTFYQTLEDIEPWVRSQRLAQRDFISVQHLLASSAIPFIFPSVPLNWGGRLEYCGDGSMRQLAPISPAIHLGAEKVLIIGAGRLSEPPSESTEVAHYPSLAQIAGHAMSSIFLDGLAVDIERLSRINKTLAMLPPELRKMTPLKPVDILVIAPSQRLDEIASRHTRNLPLPVRTMLSSIGATEVRGSALASYLLFESSYTKELIELGKQDTYEKRDEVSKFFSVSVDECLAQKSA